MVCLFRTIDTTIDIIYEAIDLNEHTSYATDFALVDHKAIDFFIFFFGVTFADGSSSFYFTVSIVFFFKIE